MDSESIMSSFTDDSYDSSVSSTSNCSSVGPLPTHPVQIGFFTGSLQRSPSPIQHSPLEELFSSASGSHGGSYISDDELYGNFDSFEPINDSYTNVDQSMPSEFDADAVSTTHSVIAQQSHTSHTSHTSTMKPKLRIVVKRKKDRKPLRRCSKALDQLAPIPERMAT